MAWWDDVWLNEAFATWMGTKIVGRWKPDWGTRAARVGTRSLAMDVDSLVTARRIRQPIESNDDIENAFDGITYQKGGAVLDMFEAWVGEETFRKGVHEYLKSHAFGNATAADFVGSIASAAKNPALNAAFFSFLDEPGVPARDGRAGLHGRPAARPPLAEAVSAHRFVGLGETDVADSRLCADRRGRGDSGLHVAHGGEGCPRAFGDVPREGGRERRLRRVLPRALQGAACSERSSPIPGSTFRRLSASAS